MHISLLFRKRISIIMLHICLLLFIRKKIKTIQSLEKRNRLGFNLKYNQMIDSRQKEK